MIDKMSRVILVTGGARSGKSRYAIDQAARDYRKKAFIATAIPFDGEMKERIAKHQTERDKSFLTIEASYDLAHALDSVAGRVDGVVIDCLTVWLGNLMHRNGVDAEAYPEVQDFLNRLENPPCDVLMVTNEIGMGIVPDNAMSRRFRDLAGKLNQDAAALADVVILMVCGHSIVIKG